MAADPPVYRCQSSSCSKTVSQHGETCFSCLEKLNKQREQRKEKSKEKKEERKARLNPQRVAQGKENYKFLKKGKK